MASVIPDSLPNTAVLVSLISISYAFLCNFLRFQRRDALHKKFNYRTREAMASMTNTDAQLIISYLAELEFPEMYYRSLQYALFKTYAFPSMSQLLVSTKQFSTPAYAPKRYFDTVLLINDFCAFPPQSERTIQAIARMNTIHGQYVKAGRIRQDGLLYTLSVFVTEPITWINNCEWRQLTEMEKCAIGTFWKSIGDAMEISYKELRHYPEWKDGIEFYEDIRDWAAQYEDDFRVPAESNKQTADNTVDILFTNLPQGAKPQAFGVLRALLEPGVRKAMMYEKPAPMYFTLAESAISIRRFLLRYLALPRPSFMRIRNVDDEPDPQTGRMHYNRYDYHPYYIKPGFWNRWGPAALMCWAMGKDLPGMKGDVYMPEGYLYEDIGPSGIKNKGQDAMKEWEDRLKVERPSGCPFALRT